MNIPLWLFLEFPWDPYRFLKDFTLFSLIACRDSLPFPLGIAKKAFKKDRNPVEKAFKKGWDSL